MQENSKPSGVHCPQCGAELHEGDQFCGKCGFRLKAVKDVPTASSKNKALLYGALGALLIVAGGVAGYFLYGHFIKSEQPAAPPAASAPAESSSSSAPAVQEQKPAEPDIRKLYYAGKGNYISLNQKSVNLGKVGFKPSGNRHIIVYDTNSGTQLLDLYGPDTTNTDTYNAPIDKYVREIEVEGSDRRFYEVKMAAGAHQKLEGYWIIGKKNGEWISYISLDNLEPFGFDKTKYHNLTAEMNAENKIVINAFHMYVAPGQASYQGKKIDDCYVTVDWDENAGTFRMY